MKRFIFIISIAFMLILSFTSCGNVTSTKAQTSIDAVAKYLSTATGGADKENPILLVVKIDLQNMLASDSGWKKLLGTINTAGKYVALDLSDCTMPNTEFNPDSGFADGKKFIVSLILPDTTESIAEIQESNPISPFQYFVNLSSVPVAKIIKSIGDGLFYRVQLNSIIIPDGFTSIGGGAFWDCGLTGVTIPNSVTYIGGSAFSGNKLKSVTIPNSAVIIESSAFLYNQLTSVTIPSSVTSIGNSAFGGNQLTNVSIPAGISSIGEINTSGVVGVFQNNKLIEVVIPNSVIIIGDNAFRNNFLTSVIIPDSVTAIGDGAFFNNQLTNIVIPDSVTKIGINAFSDNPLISIAIPKNVETSRYSGSIGFNDFLDTYWKEGSLAGTYTRPDTNSRTWTRQ